MATWITAARAAIGRTSNQISRQTLSSSTNETSKLIHQRGLATGAGTLKGGSEAKYIIYTGLVRYLDDEVPAS
ncbi:hypothetical protein C5167_026379 [Papaver somniferum]|nr:hypothetical protein C5167_026379 [Papaver somniferum]